MRTTTFPVAGFVLALVTGAATAGALPTQVGHCTTTTIEEITSRLEGVPGSGDVVIYANGGYGVSYDIVPGLSSARLGDSVKLCLTFIPEECPPGDDRGRFYRATNLRNDESWELPDSQHMCGGA